MCPKETKMGNMDQITNLIQIILDLSLDKQNTQQHQTIQGCFKQLLSQGIKRYTHTATATGWLLPVSTCRSPPSFQEVLLLFPETS